MSYEIMKMQNLIKSTFCKTIFQLFYNATNSRLIRLFISFLYPLYSSGETLKVISFSPLVQCTVYLRPEPGSVISTLISPR